jgi:hypothetical protein
VGYGCCTALSRCSGTDGSAHVVGRAGGYRFSIEDIARIVAPIESITSNHIAGYSAPIQRCQVHIAGRDPCLPERGGRCLQCVVNVTLGSSAAHGSEDINQDGSMNVVDVRMGGACP